MLQNQEFAVGLAAAMIVLSAVFASPLFRNIALAPAAGSRVLLHVPSGIPGLLAPSKTLEAEFKAIPDFAHGLPVGAAIPAVLLHGLRQRGSSSS